MARVDWSRCESEGDASRGVRGGNDRRVAGRSSSQSLVVRAVPSAVNICISRSRSPLKSRGGTAGIGSPGGMLRCSRTGLTYTPLRRRP